MKKEILYKCDLDYIISFDNRKEAIEYMTNFQSSIDFLNNINIIESLNIDKKLMNNIYETFYKEKNVDDIIKLYNLMNSNKEELKLLNQIFYTNLTKIFSFAHKYVLLIY